MTLHVGGPQRQQLLQLFQENNTGSKIFLRAMDSGRTMLYNEWDIWWIRGDWFFFPELKMVSGTSKKVSVLVKILVLSHSEYDQEVSDQASGKEEQRPLSDLKIADVQSDSRRRRLHSHFCPAPVQA